MGDDRQTDLAIGVAADYSKDLIAARQRIAELEQINDLLRHQAQQFDGVRVMEIADELQKENARLREELLVSLVTGSEGWVGLEWWYMFGDKRVWAHKRIKELEEG